MNPQALAVRRVRRRVELAERLLAASEELDVGSGEGLAAMSVRDLSNAAGISRSLFYRHFYGIGEFLSVLVDEAVAALIGAAAEWWTADRPMDEAALRDVLSEVVDAHVAHRQVMRAASVVSAGDPHVRERLDDAIGRMVDALTAHLEAGQLDGLVRPSLDARRTAWWLAQMGEHGFDRLTATADEEERARLVDALAPIVWHAVYCDGH